jgi:hypothetical protein
MKYLGIDWADRRAAWCALRDGGDIADEGFVPADKEELAKPVMRLGAPVRTVARLGARSH